MIINECIENFLTSMTAQEKSPLTIDVYKRELSRLMLFTGNIEITEFTSDMVNRYTISKLVTRSDNGNNRSEITISRTKAVLRSFGRYLEEEDLLDKNPARTLKIKRPQRKDPVFLTPGERKRLIKAISRQRGTAAERDLVIIQLFLGTGIRLAELVGLDICDVRLDDKKIDIKVKGGRKESRFLGSKLRRLLKAWLRKRRDDNSTGNIAISNSPTDQAQTSLTNQSGQSGQPLFISNRKTRITARQVERRFTQWLTWANIDRKLTIHSLRHTFATNLYGQTRNLILTSKALGHRQVSTTQIYTHLFDYELEDAIEDLG